MSAVPAESQRVAEEVAEYDYAVALCHLPKLNPARLRWLLTVEPQPSAVWERVVRGRLPLVRSFPDGTLRSWTRAAGALSPPELGAAYRRRGVRALVRGGAGYPHRLERDPDAPAVLFALGDLDALERPTVAIVGTRRATGYGRDVARGMGRQLAAQGVVVMSGLAVGIDLAAQRGALKYGGTPVVGVAGTGLDVVYPPEGRDVWDAIGGVGGLLVGEAPLGAPPSPWRFPQRNRIMAGLADLVVVVESPLRGGSMLTVNEAMARGIDVMAVPGPVTSAASAGCNRLILDGAGVACEADDVVVRLGLASRPAGVSAGKVDAEGDEGPPDPRHADVFRMVDVTPTSFDRLLGRTTMPAVELSAILYELEAEGWVGQRDGCWERRPPPTGST